MFNPNPTYPVSTIVTTVPQNTYSTFPTGSILKQQIDRYHDQYLIPIGQKVVDYFMRQFREANEVEEITKFKAIICCEDDRDFWEQVVQLSFCDADLLAKNVGIVMNFVEARTCEIKWSGK